MKKITVFSFGLLFTSCFLMIAYSAGEESGKVIIFHAGSLSVPFAKIEKNFEKMHPRIDIEREASGSTACARKITDLKKPCDIMASADYRIIEKFLIPDFATWYIRFAGNAMVLCYTDKSRLADKVNQNNWFDILSIKGVVWGHSDPNLDPCGYRALMVLKLAEKYYRKPGLYQKLIDNRPVGNIRPKSVELVSLLQTGNMDYAWEYRSVAVQHGLRFLELPLKINLSDPAYDDFYRQAMVKISGKRPGQWVELRGRSITYGVTLLKKALDFRAAIMFLEYLLSPEGGLKIMNEMGQTPITPPEVPSKEIFNRLPEELRPLVNVETRMTNDE